jgi:hypothetical protein
MIHDLIILIIHLMILQYIEKLIVNREKSDNT